MARPFASRKAEPEERPDLAATLEHYGIEVNTSRTKQMILCPAHSEEQKSCSVNLDKGLWQCFSCGAAGDVWTLIETLEGVDHRGARAFAALHGLSTRTDGGSDSDVRASPYARSSAVPDGSRNRGGGSTYQPPWRRRGPSARI